jgi:hypothetical protein
LPPLKKKKMLVGLSGLEADTMCVPHGKGMRVANSVCAAEYHENMEASEERGGCAMSKQPSE